MDSNVRGNTETYSGGKYFCSSIKVQKDVFVNFYALFQQQSYTR